MQRRGTGPFTAPPCTPVRSSAAPRAVLADTLPSAAIRRPSLDSFCRWRAATNDGTTGIAADGTSSPPGGEVLWIGTAHARPLFSLKPPSLFISIPPCPLPARTTNAATSIMALPEAYQREIEALSERVLQSSPRDILQFCADFFAGRLASERAAFLSSQNPAEAEADTLSPDTNMSDSGFGNPFAANSNPFGSSDGRRLETGPIMQQVIEEDETAVTSPTTPSFAVTGNTNRAAADACSTRACPLCAALPPANTQTSTTLRVASPCRPSPSSPWPTRVTTGLRQCTPKTKNQLERLQRAIGGSFLFSHLDEEQSAQILGALVEKPIPTKDIKVGLDRAGAIFRRGVAGAAADAEARLSPRATQAITSTSSRRGPSTSSSTPAAACSRGSMAWARRSAPSTRAARLAS